MSEIKNRPSVLEEAAIEHAQKVLPQYQLSRGGWVTKVTGIEEPGDCGDEEVTVISRRGVILQVGVVKGAGKVVPAQ